MFYSYSNFSTFLSLLVSFLGTIAANGTQLTSKSEQSTSNNVVIPDLEVPKATTPKSKYNSITEKFQTIKNGIIVQTTSKTQPSLNTTVLETTEQLPEVTVMIQTDNVSEIPLNTIDSKTMSEAIETTTTGQIIIPSEPGSGGLFETDDDSIDDVNIDAEIEVQQPITKRPIDFPTIELTKIYNSMGINMTEDETLHFQMETVTVDLGITLKPDTTPSIIQSVTNMVKSVFFPTTDVMATTDIPITTDAATAISEETMAPLETTGFVKTRNFAETIDFIKSTNFVKTTKPIETTEKAPAASTTVQPQTTSFVEPPTSTTKIPSEFTTLTQYFTSISENQSEFSESLQVCTPEKYTCQSESQCIDYSKVCDGVADCDDESDELPCITPVEEDIPESAPECVEFDCGNNECVSLEWRCDGHMDCSNGKDEENCESKATKMEIEPK